jgi:hypothetical protein
MIGKCGPDITETDECDFHFCELLSGTKRLGGLRPA